MASGIKVRLLDNKKLLYGKATLAEKDEVINWARITHESIRKFITSNELPIAVVNACEDRMIELSEAITKLSR